MSQVEYTDLLCKARRQELSADEQRRLNELVQSSTEARLMSHMLSEFERESRVRPGDDLLLARINARVLGVPERAPSIEKATPARRRRPLTTLLLVAAVLLVAGLAAAWVDNARKAHSVEVSMPHASAWAHQGARPQRARPTATARPEPSGALPAEVPSSGESTVDPAPARDVAPNAAPRAASGHDAQPAKLANSSSARELFARANLLRRQGRSADAAGLYRLLLELYPNSREVGPTRLALAKHLQATDPAAALAQYRALAANGGALRAEALWGISETAMKLGTSALAEQALSDLVREFPESPYAEVARGRTLHGSP
jgi:tetratricopeptide (TPR) repeat protein